MGTKLTSLADRTLQFLRECYDPICVLTCLALALVPLSVCAVLYRRCKHLAKSFNSVVRALIILCIVECLVILLRPLFNLHGAPAYLSGILIWTVLAAFLVFATGKRRVATAAIRCFLLRENPWVDFLLPDRLLGRYRRIESFIQICCVTEVFLNRAKNIVCNARGFLLFAFLGFVYGIHCQIGRPDLSEYLAIFASSDIAKTLWMMLSVVEEHSTIALSIIGAILWLFVHRRYHLVSRKVVREREESCFSFISHVYPVFQRLSTYLVDNIECCISSRDRLYCREISSDRIEGDWIGVRLDAELLRLNSLHKDYLQQDDCVRSEVIRSIFYRCGGIFYRDRCYDFWLSDGGATKFISANGVDGILCHQTIEAAVRRAKESDDFNVSLDQSRDSMILESALACIDAERFVHGFAPLLFPHSGFRAFCQGLLREKE